MQDEIQNTTIGKVLSILKKKVSDWIVLNRYKYFVIFIPVLLGTTVVSNLQIHWALELLIIAVGCAIVLILDDIVEKKKSFEISLKLDLQYAIAFDLASKATHNLADIVQAGVKNISYNRDILTYISRSVALILSESSAEVGQISTNVMLPINNYLTIVLFDTNWAHRSYLRLFIPSSKKKLFGARKAYKKGQIAYVPDTSRLIYGNQFNGKPYRSFISIPVFENEDDTGQVIAIINIDSSIENQFVNISAFKSKILRAITPLITVVRVLTKNGII